MNVAADCAHLMKTSTIVADKTYRDFTVRLKFALQVHGGQDCEVWFKDIETLAE